jgi:hypothetical protein
MRTFVIRENIRHYRLMLDGQLDPERRKMVERLLAEEEAALVAASSPLPAGAPRPDGGPSDG